jgi:glycosyltransferase involved in cell wall biosynthesis
MISIVVPVFNESESVEAFFEELLQVLNTLDSQHEVIFVDDGSTDNSLDLLKTIAKKTSHVRVFSFRKNQGKAEALTFGFGKAKGDVIVTLDADLQDKPSQIHLLLEKLNNNWDVVCGWRKHRKDPQSKIISSKIFNFLAAKLWGLTLHDYNCGLKAYTKEAAKSLHLYGGFHRFIPLLAYQQGFTVTEVSIEHDARKFGKSKYGFSKLWKDLPDIFTMLFLSKYSDRPLHFFGFTGGLLFTIGVFILGYLTFLHFQGIAIGRRPLLTFGMLFVLSGLQVFVTGFLADLLTHHSRSNGQEYQLKYSSEK